MPHRILVVLLAFVTGIAGTAWGQITFSGGTVAGGGVRLITLQNSLQGTLGQPVAGPAAGAPWDTGTGPAFGASSKCRPQ